MLKRIIAAALFLSANTQAVDVIISGRVLSTSCTVSSELSSGQAVRLGNLSRNQFSHAGNAEPEWHNFSLILKDCPDTIDTGTVTFTGIPDSRDGTLFANIAPSETAATNVAVQVSKQSDNESIISNGSKMTEYVDTTNNTITFPLAARMYTPVGGVQAGDVAATMLVDFTYQ